MFDYSRIFHFMQVCAKKINIYPNWALGSSLCLSMVQMSNIQTSKSNTDNFMQVCAKKIKIFPIWVLGCQLSLIRVLMSKN